MGAGLEPYLFLANNVEIGWPILACIFPRAVESVNVGMALPPGPVNDCPLGDASSNKLEQRAVLLSLQSYKKIRLIKQALKYP